MNVSGIFESLQQGQSLTTRSLAFEADRDSTHTVGAIIKGKVMRHYEGSRYSVSFGGNEKVVDSSVPLSTGELIRGRVVAVDDKVHVQRIFTPDARQSQQQLLLNNHLLAFDQPGSKAILPLFEQYQVKLTASDFQLINQLVTGASDSSLMALSALLLVKSGSQLEPEFIRAIYRFLKDGHINSPLLNADNIVALEMGASTMTSDAVVKNDQHTWMILSELMQRYSRIYTESFQENIVDLSANSQSENETENFSSGSSDSRDLQRQYLLGERLLNVQNDNSVAHRLINFPLLFDDKLVEISLAFFSEKQGKQTTQEAALGDYRKIVFSLETENLGYIEVTLSLANRRVQVEFVSDDSGVSTLMARHAREVKHSLLELEWQVDEISYNTVSSFEDGVLHAVVEHYISQDSFSRLM